MYITISLISVRMAKYQRLLSLCTKVLSNYDSTKCGIDDHLTTCLASNDDVSYVYQCVFLVL